MLLNIEITNFFSVKEKVSIDFRAANIHTQRAKELGDNVIDWNGIKVLKSIGLFGPNASGKSSILKAITFCCRMILDSHQYNEGVRFNYEP
ncbi:MAG: ATP-binding protein, partial [Bacteroidaceae bacterium]|nr:ATP-binding protein [Bacteroidaceae bacterium]